MMPRQFAHVGSMADGDSGFARLVQGNSHPLCLGKGRQFSYNLGLTGRSATTLEGGSTLARSRVRRPTMRLVIAALAAVGLSAAFLGSPGHSRGAGPARSRASMSPWCRGSGPRSIPAYSGVGKFPATNSRLSAYHFSELATSKLTASGLASYDTVILYGIRWSDIPASGQAALNTFAATHKVMIWDADETGAQNYCTFIQPFSTRRATRAASPRTPHVTFPTFANGFVNFLASNTPSSPYYLDPSQLVTDPSMINDMNAMNDRNEELGAGSLAANANIPKAAGRSPGRTE